MLVQDYRPASQNPFSFGVKTPGSMAQETQAALQDLIARHGNIDTYLSTRLGYPDLDSLYRALGAEQIDGVALAIAQIERGAGLIIGDQTGIGKGRQAAAIVRYGVLLGKKPVFLTQRSNLFSDLFRDLEAIGSDKLRPLVLNNEREANIVDENGVLRHRYQSRDALRALLAEETFPEGYDLVMATYSQLAGDLIAIRAKEQATGRPHRRKKQREQHKTQFLRRISHDNIFICDEAHEAAGLESNRGFFMREILRNARGVCYLSATYAKRPDNMPLYAVKTAMREANLSDGKLVEAIKKGGVALQEIIAADLVGAGQMIRRQRTYEGVKVSYQSLEAEARAHREISDQVTALIREIIAFQEDYIKPWIDQADEDLRDAGSGASQTRGTQEAGISNQPFVSKVFNLLDQLIFSLKARPVAQEAIRLLEEDKKVVIAFKSTMGSFLSELELVNGDPVYHDDFSLVLQKALDGVMRYSIRNGWGHAEALQLSPQELGPEGKKVYETLRQKIQTLSFGISLSPIDVLIRTIETASKKKSLGGHKGKQFKVAEVTGRKQRIVLEAGIPVLRPYQAQVKAAFRAFNAGEIDVLLINQSGSTGASAHSSKNFADQRQRVMLIHQAELNINTEVQKRGRIFRTGQVNLPEYRYLTTAIPAESRPLMILKKKLRSLDANTTGSQQSSATLLETVDFFNKYGNRLVSQWLRDNPEVDKMMGGLVSPKKNQRSQAEKQDDFANKVAGRVNILPVAIQERFYQEVGKLYAARVEYLKQTGQYDLEAEYEDLKAKPLKRYLAIQGKGGISAFGDNTYLERSEINVLRKPMRWEEVQKRLAAELAGRSAEEYQADLIAYAQEKLAAITQTRVAQKERKRQKAAETEAAWEAKYLAGKKDASVSEKELEKRLRRYRYFEKERQEAEKELIQEKSFWQVRQTEVLRYLRFFEPGKPLLIPSEEAETGDSVGLFIGFQLDKTASNPFAPSRFEFRFAIADSRRYRSAPESEPLIASLYLRSQAMPTALKEKILTRWDYLRQSQSRMKRFIATGNLLQAMGQEALAKGGRLIKFSTEQGEIRSGLLTPVKFGTQGLKTQKPLSAALGRIKALRRGEELWDSSQTLRFKHANEVFFHLYVPSSAKKGGPFFRDEALRPYLEPSPEERAEGQPGSFRLAGGGEFVAEIRKENLEKLVQLLSERHALSIELSAEEARPESQQQSGSPESASPAPPPKPPGPKALYRYQLHRPFGPHTQPAEGLQHHERRENFALLIYDRPLQPAEKARYGLLPHFESVGAAFRAWEAKTKGVGSLRKAALEKSCQQFKKGAYETGFTQLGRMMIQHNPEPGNPELFFGSYSEAQLGLALIAQETCPAAPLFAALYLELQPPHDDKTR